MAPMPTNLWATSFFLLSFLRLPSGALGAASEPLLGGEYVPTTDVGYITDLTELLDAIEQSTDSGKGLEFYKKVTDLASSTSLEHLSTVRTPHERANPLSSILKYALYRSDNGNGNEIHVSRDGMEFLDKPIDNYGDSIVIAEFNKRSGYNPVLTAETIRATNVWMGTANALYEGVALCRAESNGELVDGTVPGFVSIDDPNYVDPIDKAAAMWIGTHENKTSMEGGSLYAWANRMDTSYFHNDDPPFSANDEILVGLKELKSDLATCVDAGTSQDGKAEMAYKMRVFADDVVKYMTVPLVQSLISSMAATLGFTTTDLKDIEDYVILYALVTLSPIEVCDSSSYDDMYATLVTNGKNPDLDDFRNALNLLQSLYICLGVTCNQVGVPLFAKDNPNSPILDCVDPSDKINLVGYTPTSDAMLQSALVDLDVRTIGTLIEMEAFQTAFDVYSMGRFTRDDDNDYGYVSVKDTAIDYTNVDNMIAQDFANQFGKNFVDDTITASIMGTDDYSDMSPRARRVIAEATMVLILLHQYAIDAMLTGIDYCKKGDQDTYWWDDAVASLIGWAEGTDTGGSTSNGYLFYNIAQYLCRVSGTCNIAGDSEVNRQMMVALTEGKNDLLALKCDSAETYMKDVEVLLDTVLVDLVAYYAEQLDDDPFDENNVAHGYIVATSLIPIMEKVSQEAANSIQLNMGKLGVTPMVDGKNVVLLALKTYVSAQNINCDLLTRDICSASLQSDVGGDETFPIIDSGNDSQESSAGLLSDQYIPTSNIDHILNLTDQLEAIESASDYTTAFDIYNNDDPGSLKSLSTDSLYTAGSFNTNPLYPIYMYALWQSANGDGTLDNKEFDDSPVGLFGHTIIMDEFEKKSGFDAQLTAETIRATNMWMAATNALYAGVHICSNSELADEPSYVNSIDKAAAFWIGTHKDPDSSEGGSLYAWSNRIDEKFAELSGSDFDANVKILDGLNALQSEFADCLGSSNATEKEDMAYKMRVHADDVARYMTVPLVQSLIHSFSTAVDSPASIDEADRVILYALVALPQIRICDKNAYNDLYEMLVTNAKSAAGIDVSKALGMLQDKYVCLGITCEEVGLPDFIAEASRPPCVNPPENILIVGYNGTSDMMLDTALTDLDVRAIGTLVEMEANNAAMDIYKWGRYSKDDDTSFGYSSIKDLTTDLYSNDQNFVSKDYISKYGDNFQDEIIVNAIQGTGDFESVSPRSRRVATEAAIVTMVLHIYALDAMYTGIDYCNKGDQDTYWWDDAVASLVGWAEGTDIGGSVNNGFLFYNIAQYLCDVSDTCKDGGDSEINRLLMIALTEGKKSLWALNCAAAESRLTEVELLLETVLVDLLAFFVEQISSNPMDEDSVSHGYIVATALVPLMTSYAAGAASTIETNLGSFGNRSADVLKDGKDVVFGALETFVTARGIDCNLLTRHVCVSVEDGVNDSSSGSENIVDNDVDFNVTNDGTSSPLLSGAYTPVSNVDDFITLTEFLSAIEESATVEEGQSFYTKSEGSLSLKTVLTGREKIIERTNPILNIYMYGLWTSEDGDNENFGQNSKVFDNKELELFWDTIVSDELGKDSGYNALLTAETIRVVIMWISVTSYLYESIYDCREGSQPTATHPVDAAAALWFGNHISSDISDGASLFAWAKRSENNFADQHSTVNEEMIDRLNSLQESYEVCKAELNKQELSNKMRYDVDAIVRVMTIPLVQYFIVHLSAQSGIMGDSQTEDEVDYMILYALSVLPLISICDEEVSSKLYSELVTGARSYDPLKFSEILKTLQDRYPCLGLSCSDIGISVLSVSTDEVPCQDPASNPRIVGYEPTFGTSFEISKIDLDVSTILSLVLMEAHDLAIDIYKYGRNAKKEDSISYTAIQDLSNPKSQIVTNIYDRFINGGVDYTRVTEASILGVDEFKSLSPLSRSAAASLSIVSIDLHLAILDAMYQGIDVCNQEGTDANRHWDEAVALFAGWAEGVQERGSDSDGYLMFNIAQQICQRFDTCDENDNSPVNGIIIQNFNNGQDFLEQLLCDDALNSAKEIEKLIEAILIDNLTYRSMTASSSFDQTSFLLAHITATALIPLMRSVDETIADVIETDLGTFPVNDYFPDGIDTVMSSLRKYVSLKGIDCSLLSSSLCDVSQLSDAEQSSDTVKPNDSGHTLANGTYTPTSDVSDLASISSLVHTICNAENSEIAIEAYSSDDSAGLTIQSMSTNAKSAMSDELMFNQYVVALSDGVEKTDGSFLFDDKPAHKYADTITSDAFKTSVELGCQSIKILNIWMWFAHKLNEAVKGCAKGRSDAYASIDEAAALWLGNPTPSNDVGGLLFEMTESFGQMFNSVDEDNSEMVHLNRQIINRLLFAQEIFSDDKSRCASDPDTVDDLRIIVKEIFSFTSAVLAQGLIHSMLDQRDEKEKREYVELFSFAFLPLLNTCGRGEEFDTLYDMLVIKKFDEADTDDVLKAIQNYYNCLGFTCDDIGNYGLRPGCTDSDLSLDNMMGYSPVNSTKTNMLAKLDLDAVAIVQLMSIENYDLARDIYVNGYSYYDYDNAEYGFVSLYDLTQSATIGYNDFTTYKLFQDYFKQSPGDLADETVTNALDQQSNFVNASGPQRLEAVKTVISNIISYVSSLEAFHFAVDQCNSNSKTAVTAWDGGVALIIGSIESGSPNNDGYFLYATSKAICDDFATCAEENGSYVNNQLIQRFTQGQKQITDESCSDVQQTLEAIESLLAIPLIQSMLFYADKDAQIETAGAAGYVSSLAVLPMIDSLDTESSNIVENAMSFPSSSQTSGQSKIEIIYGALKSILTDPSSFIDCELISNAHPLCDDVEDPNNVIPVNVDKPTTISHGLYIAKNYVDDRSAIAKDVEEIQEFLDSKDIEGAKLVYKHGSNSKIYSKNGMPIGIRSISSFSLQAGSEMQKDPTYNMFVYGLSDDNDFLGKSVLNYADTFVNWLLESSERRWTSLASEAVVALHIWMQVAHKLHAAYDACKLLKNTSERRSMIESSNASLLLDEAAAYWIGDNQSTGSSSQGHLLYALTEKIGEQFEDISAGSQSAVNSRIIDLFNQAKNHIAITNGCSTSQDAHLELRSIVGNLIPMMAVPLLRCLHYYLSIGDAERVKLYAISVLPLFSHCSPSSYLELKNDLIDHDVNEVDKEYIFFKIRSMYDCLGLSCDVVGSLIGDDFAFCDDSSMKALAGYLFRTDRSGVIEASRIDVDIRAIDIFINNGMYLFQDSEVAFAASFECYKYGHNIAVTGSNHGPLQSLATSSDRDVVPAFSAFRRYFKDDDDYADSLLDDAFIGNGVFENANADERRRAIAFILRYMVTHMSIEEKIHTAVEYCKSNDFDNAASALDSAVAYLIGSMEGEEDGGSYDGNLIYMLAKRMCVHFGTCAATNNAQVNEHIISLFYAGQGEVEAGACGSLSKTVNKIDAALLVPLIQGVIFASLENELYFEARTTSEGLFPEGYVLSQSILPMINDALPSAAKDIQTVMVDGFPSQTSPAAANHMKVILAVRDALRYTAVDCDQVGSIAGVNVCTGAFDASEVRKSASRSASLFMSAFSTLAASAALALVVLH